MRSRRGLSETITEIIIIATALMLAFVFVVFGLRGYNQASGAASFALGESFMSNLVSDLGSAMSNPGMVLSLPLPRSGYGALAISDYYCNISILINNGNNKTIYSHNSSALVFFTPSYAYSLPHGFIQVLSGSLVNGTRSPIDISTIFVSGAELVKRGSIVVAIPSNATRYMYSSSPLIALISVGAGEIPVSYSYSYSGGNVKVYMTEQNYGAALIALPRIGIVINTINKTTQKSASIFIYVPLIIHANSTNAVGTQPAYSVSSPSINALSISITNPAIYNSTGFSVKGNLTVVNSCGSVSGWRKSTIVVIDGNKLNLNVYIILIRVLARLI